MVEAENTLRSQRITLCGQSFPIRTDLSAEAMDELVRRTKLPAAKVNSLCMALRLKGRVRFFPGNRVALPRAE